jgi:hypothetical protein
MAALVLVDGESGQFEACLDSFPGFLHPVKATVDECEVIGERFQDVLNQ